MTLPDDFSPWEHLQDTIKLAHNTQVRNEFSDVEVDNDISTPRLEFRLS